MSNFLGIDLIAGLNEAQSQQEINKTIRKIQDSGRLDDLKIELKVDEKVLSTIREFNREFKKLSAVAEQTGKTLNQAVSSSGGKDIREQKLQEAITKTGQLSQATKNQSATAVQANREEIRTVDDLLKRYTVLNREVTKRDASGKVSEYRYDVGDKKGHQTATIYATPEGLVKQSQDVNNIEKQNKEIENLVNERQKILDKLGRMRMSGYGDDKVIGSFDQRAMSNDINLLKNLSKEVDTYSRTLPNLDRKDSIQQTINSMERLHKAGAIRLPKNNMLTDIRERLGGATTKKEIDDVQSRLNRLNSTLSGRDRGFVKIEKMRADDILPAKTLTEVRERLRKAQSPEQVQIVSGQIDTLEKQNAQLRTSNREANQLATQRQAIYNKIAQIEQMQGAKKGTVRLFKQQTADQNQTADSLRRLRINVDQYSQSLGRANQTETLRQGVIGQLAETERRYGADSKRIAQFRQQATQANLNQLRQLKTNVDQYSQSLQRMQSIEGAQRKFHDDVSLLRGQIAGRVSPQHEESLKNIADRYRALSPQTENLTRKQGNLRSEFRLLRSEIVQADQGMARFSRQIASAMLRIPIYAAGMAAMYAPLRMFQSAISQSIEINSQMTVLERVSNGTIEMNKALEDSIGIAERLGNVIGEVNEGLISFARQGYRGDELTSMTEYATLMSNVSDLSVDDSASALTAAMKGFNIEAKESIHVVNAMNEVNVNQPPYTVMCM